MLIIPLIIPDGTCSAFRGVGPRNFADLYCIRKLGIRTVLSLETGCFEFLHGQYNQEVINSIELSMAPIQLHLSNVLRPTFKQIDTALRVLGSPRLCPVFFHCLQGKDRTGIIGAAYRIKYCGWTVDAAINEMLAFGFHSWCYAHWVRQLREWAKRRDESFREPHLAV